MVIRTTEIQLLEHAEVRQISLYNFSDSNVYFVLFLLLFSKLTSWKKETWKILPDDKVRDREQRCLKESFVSKCHRNVLSSHEGSIQLVVVFALKIFFSPGELKDDGQQKATKIH